MLLWHRSNAKIVLSENIYLIKACQIDVIRSHQSTRVKHYSYHLYKTLRYTKFNIGTVNENVGIRTCKQREKDKIYDPVCLIVGHIGVNLNIKIIAKLMRTFHQLFTID